MSNSPVGAIAAIMAHSSWSEIETILDTVGDPEETADVIGSLAIRFFQEEQIRIAPSSGIEFYHVRGSMVESYSEFMKEWILFAAPQYKRKNRKHICNLVLDGKPIFGALSIEDIDTARKEYEQFLLPNRPRVTSIHVYRSQVYFKRGDGFIRLATKWNESVIVGSEKEVKESIDTDIIREGLPF